jgi:parallel beta-helix repeat protein
VKTLCAVALVLIAAGGASGRSTRVIDVPGDEPTIAAAIAAAAPGDTVLIAPGTYRPSVKIPAAKHDLTIRGADRNAVVFDGRGTMRDAIDVEADRVTIENVSAHSYLGNVFYWDDVTGFTARYLTVWNVLGYGIYAEHSTGGLVERDYVSGAADAAYYIGECNPCNTEIRHVVARLSAVGYSGTNASGSLSIQDSRWDQNGAAILPNSYANEEQPPQERATIVRNVVTRSGTVPVPLHTPLAGFWGIGIGIAGGHGNRVTGNTVTGSARYGIALFPTEYWIPLDPRPRPAGPHRPWQPIDNVVTGNRVAGSRLADLGLAGGRHNCFAGNAAATVAPAGLRGCRDSGDPRVAADLTAPLRTMLARAYSRFPPPPFGGMPKPPPQPTLPR